MNLRPATLDDARRLAQFGRDTFEAAFGHLYARADLDDFYARTHTPEIVAAQIEGADYEHRLAVDADDTYLGYCKLGFAREYDAYTDAANPVQLSQLYTAPGAQNAGLGTALMEWALATARARGHDAMLLSVWSENMAGQRFYARHGFAKIADIHFHVGSHVDDEFLFETRL